MLAVPGMFAAARSAHAAALSGFQNRKRTQASGRSSATSNQASTM